MPSFLEFLKSIKKALFFWKKGAILGVDIGSSAIKVVLIEKVEEKVILRNYAELSLGPTMGLAAGQAVAMPPERVAEELLELLREAKISPAQSFMAIPLNASLLSVVELPDVAHKEIETMIPIEARRYIPVPLNEVSLDWWALPKNGSAQKPENRASDGAAQKSVGQVEVIIAAIHNEVINKYVSIERNAQLSGGPSHFEIEIFSTLRAVAGTELSPTLLLDIGASTTNMALVHNGLVHASHVIATGGQDITQGLARSQGISFAQAEEIKCRVGMLGDQDGRDVLAVAELLFANVMNEAVRFTESYEQKHQIKIAKIVLVGGGARLQGIEKIITKSFPGAMVERGNPFTRVDTPAFLSKTLETVGPHFATALGTALKGLE